MNEMKTTAVFAAIAALSLGGAWIVRPKAIRSESEITGDLKGQAIFKELDPDSASSLKIVKFNEELAQLSQLELAKDSATKVWSLPSSDGYAADSAEKVSQAIAPLTELTVLSTVSTDRGAHSMYGVIEPKEDQLDVSTTGVGTLLRVGGPNGDVLASLIIGKAVEGATDQRYVRVPTEDAVYIVEMKTDAYSTQFDAWIKGEILTVRGMDINYVGLRDYAIIPVDGGFGLARNFDSDLIFNENKWSLSKFVDHKIEGSPESNQLPEGKVLADAALNDLRNSVQNLKIINVRRKPAGLAQDLKADKSLLANKESTKSLQSQGFFPMDSGDVFAAGGELIVGTKDGIRYLLRFGNAIISSAALADDKKEKKDDDSSSSSRRYLLVTAQLDESKFPVPALKVVPETVEQMLAMEAAEKAKASGVTAPVAPAEAAPKTPEPSKEAAVPEGAPVPATEPANPTPTPTEPTTAEPTTAEPKTEPAPTEPTKSDTPGEPAKASETPAEPAPVEPAPADIPKELSSQSPSRNASLVKLVSTNQQEGKQEETKQEEGKADASQTTQQPLAETPKTDAAPAQTTPAQATPAGPGAGQTELAPSRQETKEELEERLQFLQESIKKENKRALDARNDSLNAAKKKVDELNAGFADWYYVVSESVYTKLRVSREQLFKAPDANPVKAGPEGPAFPPNFGLPPGN